MHSTASVAFLVVVSIAGLLLIPVLVLQPALAHFDVSARQSVVGALYFAICVLGIAAVFYPAKCRSMFGKSQNPLSKAKTPSAPLRIVGHHPDCQHFSANRIKLGGRAVCAACTGLLSGAIIALVGTAAFFFVGLHVAWASIWLLLLGEGLMLLGLVQIKFAGYGKVVVNAVFVIGSFVTLIEVDALGESLLVDLLALGLIAYLLWFRILLSEWNNSRICKSCRSCLQ